MLEQLIDGEVQAEELFLGMAGHRIKLPMDRWPSLAIGQQVSLGIRPEHLELCSESEEMFTGEADVVEQLGDRTDVIMSSSNVRFTARVVDGANLAEGQRLHLKANLERVHLFDVNSGRMATTSD